MLAACVACGTASLLLSGKGEGFTAGVRGAPSARNAVVVHAEPAAPAPAPSPGSSVALVKVSEENKLTTASVVGGLAGLWFGGLWLGAGVFAATTFLTRSDKDSDVSKAVQGIAGAGLEVLNFAAGLNAKYEITGSVGTALTDALENAKTNPDTKVVAEPVSNLLQGVGDAIGSVDQDVGIKDTLGSIATSASELAYTATSTVAELNDKYKVTDKIKEKVDEVAKEVNKD